MGREGERGSGIRDSGLGGQIVFPDPGNRSRGAA